MLKFVRSRIQVKLVLVFVVVLLASAAIASQVFADFSVGLLISGEQASEAGLVRSQVQVVENQLSTIKDAVVDLSLAPDTRLLVESLVSAPGHNIIGNFQDSVVLFLGKHPAYGSVAMLDTNGHEVARIDNAASEPQVAPSNALADRSASPYFIQAENLQAGAVYVSGLEPAPDGAALRYSTPVFASTGDAVGVLTLTATFQLVTAPFLSEQGRNQVYLLDSSGAYLLTSDPTRASHTNFLQGEPHDAPRILSGAEGSIVQSADSPDYLQTYQQFAVPADNALKFTILREKPIEELLARTNGVRESTFLVFGIAVVILAAIMWFLTRPIVQPLRELEASAAQISQGNFDAALPTVHSSDELGALAAAFITMSRELRTTYAELEQRVAQRTEQLEMANKELEAFTYSVSHDLRAPVRAIDGFSRTLAQDYRANLPEKAQHYLDRIQHNARHMGNLIDDLLALSRIGRQVLHFETVDMNALVQEVLGELKSDSELGVAEISVGPLVACVGDRTLLKQVIVNLISNALKYSRKRSEPRIEIRSTWQQREVVYAVADNGAGFDMQYAGQLFGVFQRLHKADEFEGTGIGLASVKRIIARHGGRIWAQAEVDKGATFYFTISNLEETTLFRK